MFLCYSNWNQSQLEWFVEIYNFIPVNMKYNLKQAHDHLFYINVCPSIIFMLNMIYIEACTYEISYHSFFSAQAGIQWSLLNSQAAFWFSQTLDAYLHNYIISCKIHSPRKGWTRSWEDIKIKRTTLHCISTMEY